MSVSSTKFDIKAFGAHCAALRLAHNFATTTLENTPENTVEYATLEASVKAIEQQMSDIEAVSQFPQA